MSLDTSPHDQHPDAAAIAAYLRSRAKRPRPGPPAADRALVLWAAAILLLGGLATLAALHGPAHLPREEPEAQAARVGPVTLTVPPALAGGEEEAENRVVGMVRLRLDAESFGPVQPATRHRLLVTLSPPDKVNEPATQLATYARFLTATVWSNPGGLVVRGFRKGSPFESDELYVSLPDGRGFAARCPLPIAAGGLDEPCRVTFRHRGLDVNLRFPREIVGDWERMLGGIRRVVDQLMR